LGRGLKKNKKIKILEFSEMARTFIEKFLGQPLLGEKVRAERRREREREKNNGVNRGHYVLHQRWRTPTAGARTSLGPIGQFIQKFKMQGTPCPIFLLNS
jgi:hypothetical protein